MRERAIRGMAGEDIGISVQTFDYYRRALQALAADWRESHPPTSSDDAIEKMMTAIKDVRAKHGV